jgi:hypothetical protein
MGRENAYGSAVDDEAVGSVGSAMVIGQEMDGDLKLLTRTLPGLPSDGTGAGLIPITSPPSKQI